METQCLFVSDLHGKENRYRKLFTVIRERKPACVFLGGDILPGAMTATGSQSDFLTDYIAGELRSLKSELGRQYPRIFMILGNDDGARAEEDALVIAQEGLWEYAHNQKLTFGEYSVFGYSYVPPTPFLLKDWERYDVSRYVDPGCLSPEEGFVSIPADDYERRWSTIQVDLERLAENEDLSKAVFLFHSPPYNTKLDRAALDGKSVDHAPLDPHVGSIAIQRFIESRQPLLTLHGHIHESARLTGSWQDKIGNTFCMNASHDGSELSVISFSLEAVSSARRDLL
ncbi:metallophosphoesterase [bacterium]|nr:metallophosphoesterase [bacterium]